MKLTNPFYYPLAMLAGGIVLVTGVRAAQLPSIVMLPVSAAIATVSASFLKAKSPPPLLIDNPLLTREIEAIRQQAEKLAASAASLRSESQKLLTNSSQIDLLSTVHYSCDRVCELPQQIDELALRLEGADSLLSVTELEHQLQQVRNKLQKSRGVAYEQLTKLADSLRRNIELAKQGEDAREAQVISLSTLITDAAGVLQTLQNQLRTSDLNDSQQLAELASLGDELKNYQENLDLLING